MRVDHDLEPVHTLCVSRRLALPPLTAIASFDDYRCRHPTLRTGPFELQFAGAPVDGPPPLGGRQITAYLSPVGRLGRIAVEIEVVAWSSALSEVTIRPVGRAVPLQPGRRRARYFDAARAVVDVLVVAVERHHTHAWATPLAPAVIGDAFAAIGRRREEPTVQAN